MVCVIRNSGWNNNARGAHFVLSLLPKKERRKSLNQPTGISRRTDPLIQQLAAFALS
jgi:hypothetical protein